MPVQLVVEEMEREVVAMTDPAAEFVSLVKHGANRMPFRVVKTEKGGKTNVSAFTVHSILLPSGVKLEELAAREGRGWLADARADKSSKHDGYQRLEQLPLRHFDQTTMQMVSLGGGALAIVGKTQGDAPADGALTISEDMAKKLMDIPETPLHQTVAEGLVEIPVQMSFAELLDSELDGMMSIIYGALKQATSDPTARKSTVLSAVDAFRGFLNVALDQVGKAEIPLKEKSKADEGGKTKMFANKEEFAKAVAEVVQPMLTETLKAFKEELAPKKEEKEEKVEEKDKAKTEAPDLEAIVAGAVAKALEPIQTQVQDLATKTEKIANSPAAAAAAATSEETEQPAAKSEEEDPKASPFAGMLTGGSKQVLSRRQMIREYYT